MTKSQRRVFSKSTDYIIAASVPKELKLALNKIAVIEGVSVSKLVKTVLESFTYAYINGFEVELNLPSGKKLVMLKQEQQQHRC